MIGYMTLAEMRDAIGRQVGDTTAYRNTRIDEWINLHYEEIAKRHLWPELVRSAEAGISLTSGERFIYLPKEVAQLLFFYQRTDDNVLNYQDVRDLFRRAGTTAESSGQVSDYSFAGLEGKKTGWHTAAEKLELVSDSTSDTAVTAVVHGMLADDNEFDEEVALNGTTGVLTTKDYADLLSVSCDGHVGIVTVTGNTSAKEYAEIAPDEVTARYKKYRLLWIPSSADSITYYFKKHVRRLTRDNQTPEFPCSHWIVQRGVYQQLLQQRKGGALSQLALQESERIYQEMLDQSEGQSEHNAQVVPLVYGPHRTRRIVVVNNR